MSARNLVLLVVVGLAAAGCDSSSPPPRTPAAAKHAVSTVPEPPKAAPAEEWVYSSVGKRDPFRSFLSELSKQDGFATKCSTPLGRYGIDQLKLVAVITGLEDPVAMVEAPTGVGYAVRRGACIGRNGGLVAAVRTGEVVVTEWVTRADGTREPVQTILQLPKPQIVPEE